MMAVQEEREICLDSEYPPVPLAYHRYLWIADQCTQPYFVHEKETGAIHLITCQKSMRRGNMR